MDSKDWEFLINVQKSVHGEHDGRNHYKYNNNDKEWINYVNNYRNGESNNKHNKDNNNNEKIGYIEKLYVSCLIGGILFIIISVIFDIRW